MKDIPRDVELYFLALVFKGDRWNDAEGDDARDLAPRQLAFIRQQIESGRYVLAGPITGDQPLVAMSIISASSATEAWAVAAADPGVQSGRLKVEIHPAYLPSLKQLKISYP